MACAYGPHTGKGKGPIPAELRWPYRFVERRFGKEFVEAWYTDDEIAKWKAEGLEDFEADRVCILLGDFPYNVFPGYTTAGLDSGFYP